MKTATHKDMLDDAWKIECISTFRWKQRKLNDGLFSLYLLLWMPTSKGWWVLMCTKSSVRACGDSTLIWLESPSSFVCTFYTDRQAADGGSLWLFSGGSEKQTHDPSLNSILPLLNAFRTGFFGWTRALPWESILISHASMNGTLGPLQLSSEALIQNG